MLQSLESSSEEAHSQESSEESFDLGEGLGEGSGHQIEFEKDIVSSWVNFEKGPPRVM
ncbi:uncharacterized protein MELLADRAFT_57193 [Melampsora larici-populina 98AG31]|uniref:Uncharacterized protein n=1 Tax=Melampsora larici-populina (strain 98AG31 / pathotype 3-4-7) TaxID=747676 RepID=F4RZE5_MELLP|nr:uncharacterized protein MELLADRAFT_57193 [Melampsora larici-populina 98AG31]EGG02212.1 hypothetical protein MELLADRAFT_57193 [Melampsora larici-populina 98AG31]